MTCHEGADFSADFLFLQGFLDPKPYVDTARSEKTCRNKKDPKSIFESFLRPHGVSFPSGRW
jgi:hypothetical protein